MISSAPAKSVNKTYHNPTILRFLFVAICVCLAVHWDSLRHLPPSLASHLSVLWIMCLYRNLNKDRTSIQSEFAIAFWVRLGWPTAYHICNTGKLYSNKNEFALSLFECFIASAIYTAIPLRWM